ncbi:carboxylesterase family protein [Streptomyces sp. NPDC001822]|uniref:carboxylesterase family protein n=1 Tax=Streptomyces sp. NPDC001822 TaxID=3364614 RepID=UPI00369F6F89
MKVFSTKAGSVAGRPAERDPDVVVLRGIPYAAPPFGANRFRAPRPPEPWEGVRDCAEFGPVAPQSARLPGAPMWSPGDEDVLSLNVWVPGGDGPLPVLVWIHGGAYVFGSSAQPDFDGTALAGHGIIIVTLNEARGLFRRAILHSPVNACATPGSAGGTTAEVAVAAGVPATYEGLLSASPRVLVDASDRVADGYRRDAGSGQRHYGPAIYGPVAGVPSLPLEPLTARYGGAARDIDLMVCHTSEEYWLLDAVGSCARVDSEDRLTRFAADFGLPGALMDGYRALRPGAPVHDIYLAVYGDMLFGEYSSRLADAHAEAGGRVHLSRFVRQRGGRGERVRAWHCADIPFAFGNLGDESLHFLVGGPPGPADHALSARLTRAWAAFVETGDPGWPPYTPSDGRTRIWDTSAGPSGESDAFRAPWLAAGLPLLAP